MLDSKFWAKYFKVYDTLNQLIPYQDLLELFLQKLNLSDLGSKNILDVGSGTGNNMEFVFLVHPRDLSVVFKKY